jgi:hypothetical protein
MHPSNVLRLVQVALAAILPAASPACAVPAAGPVLIENVTVVSPERETPLREAFLRADPLASVDAWNAIETVILRGEPLPRESLSQRSPGRRTSRSRPRAVASATLLDGSAP